jgi:hypothetical protein
MLAVMILLTPHFVQACCARPGCTQKALKTSFQRKVQIMKKELLKYLFSNFHGDLVLSTGFPGNPERN